MAAPLVPFQSLTTLLLVNWQIFRTVYLHSLSEVPGFVCCFCCCRDPSPSTPSPNTCLESSVASHRVCCFLCPCVVIYSSLLSILQEQPALLRTAVNDAQCHTSKRESPKKRVPTKRKVFTGNGQKMEAFSLCWAKEKLSMWILSSLNKFTKSVTDVGIKFRSCVPAMGHNSSC